MDHRIIADTLHLSLFRPLERKSQATDQGDFDPRKAKDAVGSRLTSTGTRVPGFRSELHTRLNIPPSRFV